MITAPWKTENRGKLNTGHDLTSYRERLIWPFFDTQQG
jgi:hypothetical protein